MWVYLGVLGVLMLVIGREGGMVLVVIVEQVQDGQYGYCVYYCVEKIGWFVGGVLVYVLVELIGQQGIKDVQYDGQQVVYVVVVGYEEMFEQVDEEVDQQDVQLVVVVEQIIYVCGFCLSVDVVQ